MNLPIDVRQVVPHAEPALLVSSLDSYDGREGVCTARLEGGHPLACPDGTVHPGGLFELLAQTYAAAGGYCDAESGVSMRGGFLVGVDRLDVRERPRVGQDLVVSVRCVDVVADCHIVEGEIRAGETQVAQGRLKIWIRETA